METLKKIRNELLKAHKEILGAVELANNDSMAFNYKGYYFSVSAHHFDGYSNDCSLDVWNFSTGRTKIGICGDIAEALELAKVMKQGKKIAELLKTYKNLRR